MLFEYRSTFLCVKASFRENCDTSCMQLHFGEYNILITYENSYGEVANQEIDDAVLLKTVFI